MIEVAFPLRELPSNEVGHGRVEEAAEEVTEEEEGVDLDLAQDMVDPGGSVLCVARSEHGGSGA